MIYTPIEMNKASVLIVTMIIWLLLAGCSSSSIQTQTDTVSNIPPIEDTQAQNAVENIDAEATDIIRISGTTISTTDSRITYKDDTITITNGGTYTFAGNGEDIQIMVDAPDEDITILLNNLELTHSKTSPFAIMDADDVVIQLMPWSSNIFTDSTQYTLDDKDINAALFSMVSLDVVGAQWATLDINGMHNDALKSEKSMTLQDLDVTISSVDDGIVAKNNLIIRNSNVSIETTGDAIKTTDEEDLEHGNITLTDSNIDIVSSADGISATNTIEVDGGIYTITTNKNSWGDDTSRKGLKTDILVKIVSGNLTINTVDDTINSAWDVYIQDGILTLTSTDDAIHAEQNVVIDNGTIDVTDSYEAIEWLTITINNGTIETYSQDDGFNISWEWWWRWTILEWWILTINWWSIMMYTDGDGLDSNGNVIMNGWTVIVHGPELDNNGAIDVDGNFSFHGDELLAIGSAWMAATPTVEKSDVPSVVIYFAEPYTGEHTIGIKDSLWNTLISQETNKKFQSIVYGSTQFKIWSTYSVLIDNTQTNTFTLDGVLTTVWEKPVGYGRRQ